MTLQEMRDKRAKLVSDARKIWDAAAKDKSRELTAEERQQTETMMDEVDRLKGDIDKRDRLEKAEAELSQSAGRRTDASNPGETGEKRDEPLKLEFRSQPGGASRYNSVEFKPDSVAAQLSSASRRALFDKYLADGLQVFSAADLNALQRRDLQSGDDVAGGYLNAPMQMLSFLLKFVDNSVVIRQEATVYQVPSAVSLGVPTLDNDLDDADWTAEIATGSGDNAGPNAAGGMKFGKRELKPHPLAKRIKVSNKLLRTAVLGPEAIVRDRLGYKFAVAQEKAFMTGNSAQQPMGVFTASANGISTARDVVGTNTSTAIVADTLFDAKYSLKPQYQKRAKWLFHRDAIRAIRKLKDSYGQYLWQPGLAGGEPDSLIDRPVLQSEYVPNTFTTGLYVGAIADWSFYWIADALTLQIQRLNELYAEQNQTGFIGRLECDGQPVLEEAFVRVKLG